MKPTGVLIAGAALAAIATVPAGADAPASATATKVVKVQDYEFRAATVRIRRGSAVQWRFLDNPSPHNVTSRGRRPFRSSETMVSGTHKVRFRRSGTYRYWCTLHPEMVGKVVVR